MHSLSRRPLPRRPQQPADSAIAPEWPEIIVLFVATIFDFVLLGAGSHDAVNWLSPLLLGVIGAWGMWRLIRRAPAAIWTPLFSLRASTVVFLAIGSLTTQFGDDAGRESIFSLYAYSPEEGAKTNTVFMAGYFLTFLSVKLASLIHHRPSRAGRVIFSEAASLRLGVIFLFLGFGFTLLIQIPILLGGGSLVLPGTLMLMFSALSAVGTFLVTLWAVERRGAAYLLVALLLFMQLLLSLIMLEKSSVMMATLLVGVAFLLNRPSLWRMAALALALGLILAVISPVITQGRIIHTTIYGDQTGGSITERLGYPIEYAGGYRLPGESLGNSTFFRLHYVAPSAFVITQYDVGLNSDTIANSLYAVIPRALWPDKPIISAIGTDLNEMITGQSTSALGVGVFADAYWNFGWAGLLIFMPLGAFLWWASWHAREIVENRDWLLMPFVLIVFRIGMSVDNFLVLAWIAPAVMSIILLVILRLPREMILASLERAQGALPVQHR